jgi:murein DD-endopeptidase MepM/ murein hydrolase activator NlpD
MRRMIHYGLLAIFINAVIAALGPYVERTIYAMRLAAMPSPAMYRLPVDDVRPAALSDSWHAPRDGGRRRHEGIDIFAPRGTAVRSATEGIVSRIGHAGLGGRAVWVLGPGGQRHYYAHLDRFAGVFAGMRVQAGTLLAYVGNSGNAKGTPPHLHYGIYTASGPINPYPLLAPAPG